MLVQLFGIEKQVTCKVAQSDRSMCYGKVGRATFLWSPRMYDLPKLTKLVDAEGNIITLRGQDLINTRKNIKLYLLEYKRLLTAPKGESPMHFNSEEREFIQNNYNVVNNPHVSGVPYWMRENHKEWTVCYRRNEDGSYLLVNGNRVVVCRRRTKFKEDAREIVETYLPWCQRCQLREFCELPCMNPTLSVQEEILPAKEAEKEPIVADYPPIEEEGFIWDLELQPSL